jgi:hypothetical protein
MGALSQINHIGDGWDTLGNAIGFGIQSQIAAYKSDGITPVATGYMRAYNAPKIIGGNTAAQFSFYGADPIQIMDVPTQVFGTDGHVYQIAANTLTFTVTSSALCPPTDTTHWTRAVTDTGSYAQPCVVGMNVFPGYNSLTLLPDSTGTITSTVVGMIHALVNGKDVGIPYTAWVGPVFSGELFTGAYSWYISDPATIVNDTHTITFTASAGNAALKTGARNPVGGRNYSVTITASGVSGWLGYTLGDSSAVQIANGTHTTTVATTTNNAFYLFAVTSGTGTITSISAHLVP